MIHTGAVEGFVVTTGTFSMPARQWALGKPLTLVDGIELVNWAEEVAKQERLREGQDMWEQAELELRDNTEESN